MRLKVVENRQLARCLLYYGKRTKNKKQLTGGVQRRERMIVATGIRHGVDNPRDIDRCTMWRLSSTFVRLYAGDRRAARDTDIHGALKATDIMKGISSTMAYLHMGRAI